MLDPGELVGVQEAPLDPGAGGPLCSPHVDPVRAAAPQWPAEPELTLLLLPTLHMTVLCDITKYVILFQRTKNNNNSNNNNN